MGRPNPNKTGTVFVRQGGPSEPLVRKEATDPKKRHPEKKRKEGKLEPEKGKGGPSWGWSLLDKCYLVRPRPFGSTLLGTEKMSSFWNLGVPPETRDAEKPGG